MTMMMIQSQVGTFDPFVGSTTVSGVGVGMCDA